MGNISLEEELLKLLNLQDKCISKLVITVEVGKLPMVEVTETLTRVLMSDKNKVTKTFTLKEIQDG